MDTKKYIIEIPDNTAWLQWVKVSDKDGHVYFDFKDPEDLTLYTEPDLDAIRKEAYDKGVQDTKQRWIDAPRTCAYKLGYESGLNDAWDAARKINVMDSSTRDELFGLVITSNITDTFSASEAIEKIRQYEQEQENEIHIGDEVEREDERYVVRNVCTHGVCVFNDNSAFYFENGTYKKTGRHFPEITEILRKLKEGEG